MVGLEAEIGSSTIRTRRIRVTHRLDGARFAASALPAGRVAVLFFADWCGYCQRFTPLFQRLPEGWVVDVSDEDLPLWETYDISVVPTVIVFQDGEPMKKWAGPLSGEHVARIEDALRQAPHENG